MLKYKSANGVNMCIQMRGMTFAELTSEPVIKPDKDMDRKYLDSFRDDERPSRKRKRTTNRHVAKKG